MKFDLPGTKPPEAFYEEVDAVKPYFRKKKVCMRVTMIADGEFNPEGSKFFDFMEAQQLMEKIFQKTNYFPQNGDSIEADVLDQPFRGKVIDTTTFFVVGRGFGVDSFEEILLYVIPERKWLELNKY